MHSDAGLLTLSELNKPEAKDFVSAHLNHDPWQLMLQRDQYPQLPIAALVAQIQSRQKAQSKIPSWFANFDLILPPALAMEQCSSEFTALYKASLVKGTRLVDLTGGAGVDTYFMSRSFKEVTYVEQDSILCAFAKHNFTTLKADNINVINQGAGSYLDSLSSTVDTIYIDPARRVEGKKVYRIQDSKPNVLELMPLLLQKAKLIMVKAAPWMDIKAALTDLDNVAKVHVIALGNDCKEVLYLFKTKASVPINIFTINSTRSGGLQEFSFTFEEERKANVDFAFPKDWLYEPNAAILKAGAFKGIGERFGLSKLHINSHLYTSNDLILDFPGRIFSIDKVIKYNIKEIRKNVSNKKANLSTRNFPHTVAQIRKKTGIKDGGDQFIFATRNLLGKPILILARKS